MLSGVVPPPLEAQSILTLRERETGGDTLEIARSGIVDINSTLLIAIDREQLRRVAGQQVESTAGVTALIQRLRTLIQLRARALATIAPAIAAWNASSKDTAAQHRLQTQLDTVLTSALEIIDLAPRGSRLRTRMDSLIRVSFGRPGGAEELYGAVFEAAAAEAADLTSERDALLREAGVFVQVGGWSITSDGARPLHFPGFDENPNLEAFDVERFGIGVIALTPEQQQELARAQELARDFNRGGVAAVVPGLTSGVRTALGGAIAPLLQEVSACGDRIASRSAAVLEPARQIGANTRTQIENAANAIQDLVNTAGELRQRYLSGTGESGETAAFLSRASDDLSNLYSRIGAVQTGLIALERALTGAPGVLRGQVAAEVERLTAAARSCRDSLQVALTTARTAAGAILKNLIGVREINTGILTFTEEVLRLDVDRVPESIQFQLRYAGERGPGDKILVRALVGAPGERAPLQEEHELTMFRVQPHIETLVGLIFADPLGEPGLSSGSRFQAGPSYSVLLKRGSRKSEIKNRLFLLSYGVNVAALDFDHDDNPEFGIGLAGSILADYLQLGIGYNIPDDQSYWFLGIRLPLPTFPLSGGAVVESD